MFNLVDSWYRPRLTLLTFLLLPLAWLFGAVVFLRRILYQIKLKKSYSFTVPVIVVGNITTGGTGKTPLVIWLASFLKEHGFKPGIVSRGVGGQQQMLPRHINANSNVQQTGDEAILLAEKTGCEVAIGIDRAAAATMLVAKSGCNIIISDDGLQHYALQRDIEIAVIDGARGLGNQYLLPAGPLREKKARLNEVDYIVRHGEAMQNEFGMELVGDKLVSLSDADITKPLSDFKQQRVHAVAAIGNPKRFFALLKKYNIVVIEHIFPDHYLLQKKDIEFFDDLPVIMTEKDAVKCKGFVNERLWYLPVVAKVDERFEEVILGKLQHLTKRRGGPCAHPDVARK
jgi:tetraacyldisaccharide 4'-kinase